MADKKQTLFLSQDLECLRGKVTDAVEIITSSYRHNNKLLVCGNGGSSSDSDHIAGELMKSFEMPRPLNAVVMRKLVELPGEQGTRLAEILQQGLPAISLSAHTALITAISNDMGSEFIFAQQVTGYGRDGDVLLAISTSGNSGNIINALLTARAVGMKTIGLTGQRGGRMRDLCDVLIDVPATETAKVQEFHLPIYHALCRMIEAEMFGDKMR